MFESILKKQKHYALVSQANWCNMTFTLGNLFPSHSFIGWPELSPPPPTGFEPMSPVWEVEDSPIEISLPPWFHIKIDVKVHNWISMNIVGVVYVSSHILLHYFCCCNISVAILLLLHYFFCIISVVALFLLLHYFYCCIISVSK